MVDRRGLDELIKFINGAEENMGMGGATHIDHKSKANGKAAKRQRQKQRKVSRGIWLYSTVEPVSETTWAQRPPLI